MGVKPTFVRQRAKRPGTVSIHRLEKGLLLASHGAQDKGGTSTQVSIVASTESFSINKYKNIHTVHSWGVYESISTMKMFK